MAQGVPGRLRPRIFLTFGTARVVGRQPYAPVAFTPEEIPGTHFQRLSRPQGTWFRRMLPYLGRINSRIFGYRYSFRLHGELSMPCPSHTCGTIRETLIQMRQKCRFCMDRSFYKGGDTELGYMKTCTEGMRR